MPAFEALTYEELNALDRASTLVVVPTGCTEQQGPHLAVDFDTWFATELCAAAASRDGARPVQRRARRLRAGLGAAASVPQRLGTR